MNNKFFFRNMLALASLLLLFTGCKDDEEIQPKFYEEIVVVTNRASGTISFINASTNQVSKTLGILGSEPVYVVYVPSKDKIYVGDRSGKKIHVVDPKTKSVEDNIDVGNGAFHMWADQQGKQLWVVNDIDYTVSVIDLNSNAVVQTINTGLQPHDVFLTKDGTKAYVSVFAPSFSMPDKVYLYSTSNFTKIAETDVTKDPHLFHLPNSNTLFVTCITGEIFALDGNNLSQIYSKPLTGAHGLFPTPDNNTMFVADIYGAKLYSVNASTGMIMGSSINTPNPTPHNVVVNENGDKMFVTHSGASANTVSTYAINGNILTTESTITVGNDPFGIAYYKREVN